MSLESRLSEEVIQNAFITMNTLIQQNRRLMLFQELSFKWHTRHHNAMKDIVRCLNRIIDHLGIDDLRPIQIIEDKSLLIPPPKFSDELYQPFYGNFEQQPQIPIPQEEEDVEMKEKSDLPPFLQQDEKGGNNKNMFTGFSTGGLNRFKTD